ncbi:Predicted nuclease of the RNAse H fold, HicB family [Rhizobiales bacterium GAS191]|nr:Predicted nuclease of the RNAse H fold, HicB family [Rhizobiales bacterium GAS191]
MIEYHAVALILGEPGSYVVVFPDFPGAGTGGDTLQEAMERAADHLAVHVEGRIEAGLDMPALRSVDEIKADTDLAEDVGDAKAIALIPIEASGKSLRVNITVDEGLLVRIDKAAARLGESRSGFLATAARSRIAAL